MSCYSKVGEVRSHKGAPFCRLSHCITTAAQYRHEDREADQWNKTQ